MTRWNPEPAIVRVMRRVVKQADGCWIFAGSRSRGYARARDDNARWVAAHLIAYEALVGPIPEGLVVDHICRVRACVNPDHLEAVTIKQNNEHRAIEGWSSSGFRNVHWEKSVGKWRVTVGHNGRSHRPAKQLYDDIEEAATAAAELRRQLHTKNRLDGAA